MNSCKLTAVMELVARHIENALSAKPCAAASSWGMAEVWLRHAENLMRNGE